MKRDFVSSETFTALYGSSSFYSIMGLLQPYLVCIVFSFINIMIHIDVAPESP